MVTADVPDTAQGATDYTDWIKEVERWRKGRYTIGTRWKHLHRSF